MSTPDASKNLSTIYFKNDISSTMQERHPTHDQIIFEHANATARSFALTLKALPQRQRRAVTLTYLIARLADTLSDAGSLKIEDRLARLSQLETALSRSASDLFHIPTNVGSFKSSEASLILDARRVLEFFFALDKRQKTASEEVLSTLISGMKWDLQTFAHLSEPKSGIKDQATLDWYCYTIAGCVGAYWVKIFELDPSLEPLAIAYGRGLQRVNILRDVASDFAIHRIYLPLSDLERFKIVKDHTLWEQSGWRNFVDDFICETLKYLNYGAHFCDALPTRNFRLRLASVLPLQIGVKTLQLIQKERRWFPPVKLPRRQVKNLVISSFFEVVFKRSFTKKLRNFKTGLAL